VWSLE
jgi:hypothetical protein